MAESSNAVPATPGQESFYQNWSTLAGYFDGDGTVEFSVKESKIEIRLAFDDNWRPFLEGIRVFLLEREVTPGRVRQKEVSRTYHVVIAGIPSVILMAKRMLPYVVKKRRELVAVLDYLQCRTTGREFVDLMNDEGMANEQENCDCTLPTTRERDSGESFLILKLGRIRTQVDAKNCDSPAGNAPSGIT